MCVCVCAGEGGGSVSGGGAEGVLPTGTGSPQALYCSHTSNRYCQYSQLVALQLSTVFNFTLLPLAHSHSHTALVGTDITEAVQQFTSTMSTELKMQWFQDAFAIRHLPWNTVLKQWSTILDKIPPQNGQDHVDMPLPMPDYKRSVVADPTSEIIPSSELWQVLWAWMPEWMTCETPECVFRASRDGYK